MEAENENATSESIEDPKICQIWEPMKFFLAGNAYFTLKSKKTGTRYTYRVSRAKDKEDKPINLWFVSLLVGPDNYKNYTYIGVIRPNSKTEMPMPKDYIFVTTGKSRLPAEAKEVKAISYTIDCLRSLPTAPGVEIWHAGKCGRCGRMLTVPESIVAGFGPECIDLI